MIPRQSSRSPAANSTLSTGLYQHKRIHILPQHPTRSSTSTPAQSDGARKPQAQRGCTGGGRRPNSRLTLPSFLNATRVLTASAASDSAPALSQVATALVLQGDQRPHSKGQIPSPEASPNHPSRD